MRLRAPDVGVSNTTGRVKRCWNERGKQRAGVVDARSTDEREVDR